MNAQHFAYLYAALIGLPFAMQIGVALGAPWGRFTVGGKFPGRLPPLWRALAVLQAAILFAMAGTVLTHAGVLSAPIPGWAIWPVLGMTCLTLLANAASPSRPERLLWTPIIGGMLIALLVVLVLG